MKEKINQTKKYEEFVLSEIRKEIVRNTGCDEKDAWPLFINAIAYNTVLEEIINKTKTLAAELEKEAVNENG